MILSVTLLYRAFLRHATVWAPSSGGTYIEGSVGQLQPLNPWFNVQNDVNRDIVSLVFSGLTRYNPETRQIEDDLAEVTVSESARIFTATLKQDLHWHDSTPELPHLVSADDVVFTFQTVKEQNFPNTLLKQNFQGVDIEKIDDRTVRFKLEESYSFFLSNLTLGILPAKHFEGVPVERLDQTIDFGFQPIGAGPYAFKDLVQTELSTEVTLERFERPGVNASYLDRVVFRIFPEYSTLLSDLKNLDGVRLVPRGADGAPLVPRRFRATHYTLPQYVALFFNLDRPFLKDQKLRLGLQLGTNKQEIVDQIGESLIVDTPLLEIDNIDWRYQFDPVASQGALFVSDWHLPEKVRLQRLLEIREANEVGALQMDPIVLLDTGAVLTLTGSLAAAEIGSTVNGIPVEQHPTATGSWIVALPTLGATGSLMLGENAVKLEDTSGKTLDTFYVQRIASPKRFKLASQEQRLVKLFLDSKTDSVPDQQAVSVSDLFFEDGFLRRRHSSDPIDVRVNASGERLTLTLLTSDQPEVYSKIAKLIKKQWEPLGVHVRVIIPETKTEFQELLLTREYDVLLFGQSLLDNLDSYPYWHSAGIQKLTGEKQDLRIDAYNLSQYASLEADSLLEVVRQTYSVDERDRSLEELQTILKNDVPAVFLYSPLYTFAHHSKIKGIELRHPSLHSDRFLTLPNWYIKKQRVYQEGNSIWSIVPWMLGF